MFAPVAFFSFTMQNQKVQCDTGTGRSLYRRSINTRKRREENETAHCICSKHNQCLAGRCRRLEEITLKTIQLLIHHCAPHDRYSMPRPALDIQYITAARHDCSIFPYTDRSTANMGINAGKAGWIVTTCFHGGQTGGEDSTSLSPHVTLITASQTKNHVRHLSSNWWDLSKKSFGVKCLLRLLFTCCAAVTETAKPEVSCRYKERREESFLPVGQAEIIVHLNFLMMP